MNAAYSQIPAGKSVDLDRIDEVTGGDAVLARELVDTLLDDTKLRLDLLEKALSAESFGDVRRCAHTLKGSSGNMGATVVARLAHDIEKMVDDGQLAQAAGLLPTLQEAADQMRKVFEAYLAALPASSPAEGQAPGMSV